MLNAQADLFLSFAQLGTRMLKRMDGQLSMHGLSFTEFQVLHHLNNATRETMTRIELARSVGLSASGVTRVIAPMEKLGLVEKESHPRDARVSLVRLSEAGKNICEETSAYRIRNSQRPVRSADAGSAADRYRPAVEVVVVSTNGESHVLCSRVQQDI